MGRTQRSEVERELAFLVEVRRGVREGRKGAGAALLRGGAAATLHCTEANLLRVGFALRGGFAAWWRRVAAWRRGRSLGTEGAVRGL